MYRNSPLDRVDTEPLIIFLGAGASFSSGIPVASKLKEIICDILPDNSEEKEYIQKNYINNENRGIQDLADYLEINASPAETFAFKEAIAQKLYMQSTIISAEYRMLAFLIKHKYISAIYTTNQDICLECSLDALGIPYNRFVYHPRTKQEPKSHANGNVDIYKLCGDIHTPYEMCFSGSELKKASKSTLFKSLTEHFGKKCRIVFIGYSVCNDPIGETLCKISQKRKGENCAVLFCVDIKEQDNHRQLIRERSCDQMIIKSAENFLADEIMKIKPRINVEHALWSQKGFGGIQTYAYSLIKIFEDFKENISPSFYYTNDFCQETDAFGFSFDLASAGVKTIQTICEKKPDLIHAHSFISAQVAETIGIPCVLTSHSLESKEIESRMNIFGFDRINSDHDPFSGDIEKYEYLYYHQLSSIIALSQAHISEIPEDVQPHVKKMCAPFISPDYLKIDVSVKSCDVREGLNHPESDNICESCWGSFYLNGNPKNNGILSENTPTITFFGRPDTRKGLHIFIRIIEILVDRGVRFQALCVGPKWEYRNHKLCVIEENASYNKTYSKIYENGIIISDEALSKLYVVADAMGGYTQSGFTEHLENIYKYFLASDIIIMPSSYETFGYVALEAMACNRPVIASNIGGLAELLSDGRGTLIDVTFPDSINKTEQIAQRFAESIIDIIEAPPIVQIKKAKEWVEQKYSSDQMKKLSSDMYDYYLKCIIRGSQTGSYNQEKVNQKVSEVLSCYSNWEEILLHTPDAYQTLRKQYYPSSKDTSEFYDLFWNIAYWLKANKSSCSEISRIPVKELAELITQITRFQPKAC